MKNVSVEVQQDHLERLIKDEPVKALSEVIWNSMDADATKIIIAMEEGPLTGIGTISVIDNGTGILFDEAEHLFSALGDSWKAKADKTEAGRMIHGEKGQGRFKAFSLSNLVSWNTFCQHDGQVINYEISGQRSSCKTLSIGDPVKKLGRGTTVEITDIQKDFRIRAEHGADEKIRDLFALYLYQYENVSLIYDGVNINAKEAISHFKTYKINVELENGEHHNAELSVAEWVKQVDRKLLLCYAKHFPFREMSPGIQARGFNFTAYLSSPHFEVLADENCESLVAGPSQ